MKEIGGYFGLERFGGKAHYPGLIALNNARSCLLYILKARKIRKLYIPYFMCDSVAMLCQREGYACAYYSIDENFLPIFDQVLKDGEWLYIVNFYGQISNKQIVQMRSRWKRVIFDNVQAFFQQPVPGVDTIYSCRKFFGVPDGGYLATDATLNQELEQDVSMDRMKHVLGRFEGSASDYYKDFQTTDHSYTDIPMRKMSELTHNILRAIDYEKVCTKRNENYAYLARALDTYNGIKLIAPDGPYCYPFYCENGMEIKRQLAKKKIYVPTLWPNVLACERDLERSYAENILPLPCDQRYGPEDMQEILCALNDYL